MTNCQWKPIASLSKEERDIDLASMRSLYESWRAFKDRLSEPGKGSFNIFNQRLIRRLSVETGILERLYDLDRGTTEALIATGFIEDLVSRSSTDIEPSRLIDILHDQEAAIQLIIDCIANNRPLTKSVIHEIHVIITAHQDTTTAIDQFGKQFEISLLKGKFKEHPNNPKRPNGATHEYCPPVHVESEMDNLLKWFSEYSSDDPIIVAAWFHHRFTQIHPYQDGNGRLARVLTTLVLLQAQLLPLVIDRDLRSDYITALEKADGGDLSSLALLFARLERSAILQALSINVDAQIAEQQNLTSAVIAGLASKFGKHRQTKFAELREVNKIALNLRKNARNLLQEKLGQLKDAITVLVEPEIYIFEGGTDKDNAHWYKHEVFHSANETGKFANFSEDHYFIKATIRAQSERLVFVTSFHHIGQELSGIMEATAFAILEYFENADDMQSVKDGFFVCSLEPFVFTNNTKVDEVTMAFARWLDTALAVAVKEYGDRL